jgi:hypothetical protein
MRAVKLRLRRYQAASVGATDLDFAARQASRLDLAPIPALV